MPKRRIYSLTIVFMFFSFAVFAALWFYVCNRYNVLYYHEQIQLFRFDGLYFRTYLSQPGGLVGYAGSFLTQFYYYPVAGAIVIACVLTIVLTLFFDICRLCGNIAQMFFIPFIPAVLLMASFVNTHFDIASALGILFALAAFRAYMVMRLPARYAAGFILFVAIYLISGGNSLLLTALMIIFESTNTLSLRKILYIALLLICTATFPWFAWKICYTVPVREAYFALTPGNFLFPAIANYFLWFSFPMLYLLWLFVARQLKPRSLPSAIKNQSSKITNKTIASWKILVPNCVLAIVITGYGTYSASDSKAEMLNQMAYEVEHENWNTVMSLGKAFPGKNRLACYFTNIALAESGQMPYRMFHYRQIGISGLFLDWQLNYFSLWYLGEIYYRLGIVAEAEHCSFEALVSTPKEPNAQTMRRLVTTNIVRRDSVAAAKYIGFFERSFAYREWARQQQNYLSMALSDTAFHIPGVPAPAHFHNFFITHQQPDYTLLMLLQSNPSHRLTFEYLMAYYMLQKDVESAKWCFDNFFGNFGYQEIPAHYEETLMVYRNFIQAGDDFYGQYPVSKVTRDRFDRYFQAFKAAQGNKRNFDQLEKQFGNTYWFYVHFIEPSTLQKKDEKNRY